MAKCIETEDSKVIVATNLNDQLMIIHSVRTPSNLNRLELKKIWDISGDGEKAKSLLELKQTVPFPKEVKLRVKETPSELQYAFKEAGLPSPPVDKTIGRKLRDLGYKIVGMQLY